MALDVLLAESRRRYLMVLSPFEREAVGGLATTAAVDEVAGLPPALLLPGDPSERSTVSSYLHLDGALAELFRQHGEVRCLECGGTCRACDPGEAARVAGALLEGQQVLAVAPMPLRGEATVEATLAELQRGGFLRIRAGDQVFRLDREGFSASDLVSAGPRLDVVVDRLTADPRDTARMTEAIRNARAIASGRALLVGIAPASEHWLNQQLTCADCGQIYPDLMAEHFLANTGSAPHARQATLAGFTAESVQSMTVGEAAGYWRGVADAMAASGPEVEGAGERGKAQTEAAVHLAALQTPLEETLALGLDHLPLSRPVRQLSTGEALLLSLAGTLSRGLTGILHIVERPLSMLDEVCRHRAMAGLRRLAELGNSVIVLDSEHEIASACDTTFAFEAGAVAGTASPRGSLIPESSPRVSPAEPRELRVTGGVGFGNLSALDLCLPLDCLVCVTGSTGAGKSAFLADLMPAALGSGRGQGSGGRPSPVKVEGGRIHRVRAVGTAVEEADSSRVLLDHLGVFAQVARLYAATPAAQQQGLPAEWFLLDRPGGRCTTCGGNGVLHYDLDFLEDLSLTCPSCEGRRYRPEALEITRRGVSVSDVLAMTASEAADHLVREARIAPRLEAACVCGLGDRHLGDVARALDPIERVRLVLAVELSRASSKNLVLLQYPAAGCHADDVSSLLRVLDELIRRGTSVWVEDRHPAVLAAADHVVELGPRAGPGGGRVVSAGRRGRPT